MTSNLGHIVPSLQFIDDAERCNNTNRVQISAVVPVLAIGNKMEDTVGRRRRRGRSAEHTEISRNEPVASASKENIVPSQSIIRSTYQPDDRAPRLPPASQRTQPRTALQAPSIQRQRPSTFHVMSSNLQKSMRENAQRFCLRVVRDKGVDGLRAEFATLRKTIDPNAAVAFMQQPAGTRNRYRDVVCLDNSRVVLKNAENDYIHANYVSTPQNDKRFICTQGPTDSTCVDFWRMVVQDRCVVVIMLCNTFEKQLKKCADYFPAKVGETLTFENMTITCRVQKIMDLPRECTQGILIKISGLVITTDNNSTHYVDHYQWMDWPDRGVPPTDQTAVALLNAVRPCKYPIVIHCSAGIGRTGTIVIMEYIIELFLAGSPFERSDEILNKIREQRSMCIQTDLQYLYVHRVLLEYFYRLNLLEPEMLPHIKKFVDDYNRAVQ